MKHKNPVLNELDLSEEEYALLKERFLDNRKHYPAAALFKMYYDDSAEFEMLDFTLWWDSTAQITELVTQMSIYIEGYRKGCCDGLIEALIEAKKLYEEVRKERDKEMLEIVKRRLLDDY